MTDRHHAIASTRDTGRIRAVPSKPSRTERFYGGYTWLVLKNVIGWTLILVALVTGPLIPGPGGIPLFLIGFALVSFPGKRKLTARVLRGRRFSLRGRAVLLVILGVSVVVPALALRLFGTHLQWLPAPLMQGSLRVATGYVAGVLLVALAAFAMLLLLNLLMRAMPPIRRRVRPWLRRHHVRLLPPRYRRRMADEHGKGPIRLKGEIVAFLKRHQRQQAGDKRP